MHLLTQIFRKYLHSVEEMFVTSYLDFPMHGPKDYWKSSNFVNRCNNANFEFLAGTIYYVLNMEIGFWKGFWFGEVLWVTFLSFWLCTISPLKKYPHKSLRKTDPAIYRFLSSIKTLLLLVSGILFIKRSLPTRFQKCNTLLGMTRKRSGI